MNKNQNYVKHIDGQILSLKINKPTGWERTIDYLTVALTDVMGRLTEEELAEVRSAQDYVMTIEEAKIKRAAEVKEMANNRDKNSI